MLWLLELTGMRISAACGLLESDIGEDDQGEATGVEYPLTPEIREVVEGARAWRRGCEFSSPTLFCCNRGRPWKHYTFSEQLRERAKVYTITPHQLRHTAGRMMAEGNLSPDIIQAGLGHGDRSSAEAYIDQTRTMRRRALRAVSESLKNINKLSTSDPEFRIITSEACNGVTHKIQPKLEITCPDCDHKYSINIELILKQL